MKRSAAALAVLAVLLGASIGYSAILASENAALNNQFGSLNSTNAYLQTNNKALQAQNAVLQAEIQKYGTILSLKDYSPLLAATSFSEAPASAGQPPVAASVLADAHVQYPGYIIVTIHSSNASSAFIQATWSDSNYTFSVTRTFGGAAPSGSPSVPVPGSFVFPVFPTSNLQITVFNSGTSAATESISVAYD